MVWIKYRANLIRPRKGQPKTLVFYQKGESLEKFRKIQRKYNKTHKGNVQYLGSYSTRPKGLHYAEDGVWYELPK